MSPSATNAPAVAAPQQSNGDAAVPKESKESRDAKQFELFSNAVDSIIALSSLENVDLAKRAFKNFTETKRSMQSFQVTIEHLGAQNKELRGKLEKEIAVRQSTEQKLAQKAKECTELKHEHDQELTRISSKTNKQVREAKEEAEMANKQSREAKDAYERALKLADELDVTLKLERQNAAGVLAAKEQLTAKRNELLDDVGNYKTQLAATKQQLHDVEALFERPKNESNEDICSRITDMWLNLAGVVERHLEANIPSGFVEDEEIWDRIRNHIGADRVALPRTNTKAAKSMRVITVLSLLAEALYHHILHPNDLFGHTKLDNDLDWRDISRIKAKTDSKKETHTRMVLLSFDQPLLERKANERMNDLMEESWVHDILEVFLSGDAERDNFRADLEEQIWEFQSQWQTIRLQAVRYEPHIDPHKEQLPPIENPQTPGQGSGGTAHSSSDSTDWELYNPYEDDDASQVSVATDAGVNITNGLVVFPSFHAFDSFNASPQCVFRGQIAAPEVLQAARQEWEAQQSPTRAPVRAYRPHRKNTLRGGTLDTRRPSTSSGGPKVTDQPGFLGSTKGKLVASPESGADSRQG